MLSEYIIEKIDESNFSIKPELNIKLNKCLVMDSNNEILKIKLESQINESLNDFKKSLIKKVYEKSREVFKKQKDIYVLRDYYCDVK
jgi:hypothetical protein